MSQHEWIEPTCLPGYRVSRTGAELTEAGRLHGCPPPAVSRPASGGEWIWLRPIGHTAHMRLKMEGLRNFFA